MTKVKTETEMLIGRNVFLPKNDKEEILASSEEKQREILPLLRKMDQRQIILFKKTLKVKPDFFKELDKRATEKYLEQGS